MLRRILEEKNLLYRYNHDPHFRMSMKLVESYLSLTKRALEETLAPALAVIAMEAIVDEIKKDIGKTAELEALMRKYYDG